MAKSKKTIRMTKADAVANPLVDQVPLWEAKGWITSPEPAPKKGDTDALEGETE